jgi:hypothetical protein
MLKQTAYKVNAELVLYEKDNPTKNPVRHYSEKFKDS